MKEQEKLSLLCLMSATIFAGLANNNNGEKWGIRKSVEAAQEIFERMSDTLLLERGEI